jgi:hypothetical protein
VTIFYDSSKGIPKELDFAAAAIGTPGEGLFSLQLLKTFEVQKGKTKKMVLVTPSVDVDIFDFNFDRSFSNVVLQLYADIRTQFDIRMASHKESSHVQRPEDILYGTVINMRFASSSSTFRQESISLSIIATISIILSTATTVWSARKKVEQIVTWPIVKYRRSCMKKRDQRTVEDLL